MPDPPLPPDPPGLPLDPEPLPIGGIPPADVELPAGIDADPLPDEAEVPMFGMVVGTVPEAPEPEASIFAIPVPVDWFADIPDPPLLPLCMTDIGGVEGDAFALDPFFPMALIADPWCPDAEATVAAPVAAAVPRRRRAAPPKDPATIRRRRAGSANAE
jgi:hypothetical protein